MGVEIRTLWDLVVRNLQRPDRPKALGIFQEGEPKWVNSHEIFIRSTSLAKALLHFLEKGEAVGLMGSPGPDWMAIDLAIQGAGGVSVPLFPNTAPNILKTQINQAKIKRIFLLESISSEQAIHLKSIEVFSPENLLLPDLPQRKPFPGGSLHLKDASDWATQRATELQANQRATIIFTSGSTGEPKGAPLTHNNLVFQIQGATERFPMGSKDKAISFLPLAHVFERMVTYSYLAQEVGILFVHHPKSIPKALLAHQPTVMTAVPRLLEKVYRAIKTGVESKSGLPKDLARWALQLALTHHIDQPKPLFAWYGADLLAYKKMRDAMGGHLRMLIVGGAPLTKSLARFFTNIGVPTYQGYGLTECSPVLAANHPGRNRPGSVGVSFPGVHLRIAPLTGEVLAKGPGIFKAYLDGDKNCFDEQNWFHTGDRGKLDDDGYLFITGRIKDRVKTSNGKYVSPPSIERELCQHPWLDQALVIAESRPYVTALLCPDTEQVPKEILQTLRESPSPHLSPHQMKDVQNHIDAINSKLNPWERVQKVQWLSSPFTIESGELTPTLKVRRHIVFEKHLDLIEALYNN